MSRPGWRRIGGVLRCRLDVRIAIEREVREEPLRESAAQRMSAEEALDLFAQPDPIITDGGMASAELLGFFGE